MDLGPIKFCGLITCVKATRHSTLLTFWGETLIFRLSNVRFRAG